jgi:hypothetical protein
LAEKSAVGPLPPLFVPLGTTLPGPTARHWRGVGHDTADRGPDPAGTLPFDQEAPPFLLKRAKPPFLGPPGVGTTRLPMPPTATQRTADGHDTPLSGPSPTGTVLLVQDAPPSLLKTAVACPVRSSTTCSVDPPTATQALTVGHDKPRKLPSPLGTNPTIGIGVGLGVTAAVGAGVAVARLVVGGDSEVQAASARVETAATMSVSRPAAFPGPHLSLIPVPLDRTSASHLHMLAMLERARALTS